LLQTVILMKNMKILLFSLAIVVTALTSFQSIAAAAQVTRINANRGFIFINGSIADGFVLGAEVCFYSASAKKKLAEKLYRHRRPLPESR
jgi:uncharacterized membrane protein (DUF485 family)